LKKWLYTLAASTAVVAFGGLQEEASASTYKVSSGDSLWKIANKHNVTVDHLKKLNELSSELIRPNQVLKVSGTISTSVPQNTPVVQTTNEYTVKAGDTLTRIAIQTNTSVTQLKSINGLSSDLIYVGQKLNVNKSVTQPAPSAQPVQQTTDSYTVKPGDSLSRIATNHGISLAHLMDLNSLNGHTIYPGQALKVSGKAASSSGSLTPAVPQQNTPSQSATTYSIKSGDTLSKIAIAHKLSLAELKRLNNLTSDLIFVGQTLTLKGTSSQPAVSQPTTSPVSGQAGVGTLLNVAQSLLSVPYVWGGSTPSGFDCSGFIYHVYQKAGYSVSRTNAVGFHARSYEVNAPQPGDLVFFENTYQQGISHVGIYLGNNQFIHAGDNGVEISSLTNSYWNSKFESFKRFYN